MTVYVPYFLIAVFVIVDGYLVIIKNVQRSSLYHNYDCWFVYDVEMLGVCVRTCSHTTYNKYTACTLRFSVMGGWWSKRAKHVANKIRKTKYIVVYDGSYKQFIYLVTDCSSVRTSPGRVRLDKHHFYDNRTLKPTYYMRKLQFHPLLWKRYHLSLETG